MPSAASIPPVARSQSPNPSGGPTHSRIELSESFAKFTATLDARIGVAIAPLGSQTTPIVLGQLTGGPAWSTMKVPLVYAALRESDPQAVTESMIAAITESDNSAAESIWDGLGDPDTAASKVQSILRATGDDHTQVQSRRIRTEYTAFGQTEWQLADQADFMARASCQVGSEEVLQLMTQVVADQRWGLGQISDGPFKGGWGPSPSGKYLVRQIGLLTTDRGVTAIAVAAQPASGSFQDGTHDLTALAHWLYDHKGELPAGRCPRGGEH
ncbi:MAG: class A beta-lactamase-related serine hydrolase [Fimbriimonadaceae bacterium]|nr:class A beta-lactamase-related serine hydrolase [Fimbriimonadaceae bacterium]